MKETRKLLQLALSEEGRFQPSKQQNLAFWLRGFDFRVEDSSKGLWNFLPQLRKSTEARALSELFLHGDREKVLCEAWISLETPRR